MKERIMQAAVQEMNYRGLRFSIRDVAGRLGISTKTLYQHFGSKEEIIAAVVERAVTEMTEAEEKLMEEPSLTLMDKLHQALIVLPRGVAFHDIQILSELKMRYPDQWEVVQTHIDKGWDNIRVLFREGVDSGLLRDFDVELFIQIYVGAWYRLMDPELAGQSGQPAKPMEQALTGMVDILLTGIRRI
ncbi:TetR/AcrR family transcriptional regulator [Paenibacillus tarimensis]|uniref:TetR/AcrR family transcriptional regulator n=1 Tax=Paenibacillus tarimensis TaxID=416012 RepID=UPI001F213131|nr:TetR/AcrR family transcriptional regulator [Paenibacillus tarimensis]MCF2945128.1 TetR/AcrR family transcriptional regulator [Paenibacillus tarimensis]